MSSLEENGCGLKIRVESHPNLLDPSSSRGTVSFPQGKELHSQQCTSNYVAIHI